MEAYNFENWIRSQSGAYYKSVEVNETVSASSTIELAAANYLFTVEADHPQHIPFWTRVQLFTEIPENLALAEKARGEHWVSFEIRTGDSGPFDTGLVAGLVEAVFIPVYNFNSIE